MAKAKYTIDTKAKKVSITQKTFESLTDDERGKIKNYIDFGFELDFPTQKTKKKAGKDKEYYRAALKNNSAALAEFERLLAEGKGERGKGLAAWRAAKEYAEKTLAETKAKTKK